MKKTEKKLPKVESKVEASGKASKRVKLKNTKPGNGEVGGIAHPLTKDAPTWLAVGWAVVD